MKEGLLKTMFSGRLCRKNYLYGNVTLWILMLLVAGVLWALLTLVGVFFATDLKSVFYAIMFCFVMVFALSLMVRRHHDLDQGGIIPVLVSVAIIIIGVINTSLVSTIGGLYTLYLLLAKGKEVDNKYGSPDKTRGIFQIIGVRP